MKKTAFIFAGGGSLGAIQVGMLKALVWEDASGQVWLGYNDPAYFAQRHGTSEAECPVVANLVKGLDNIAKSVTAPE